MHDSRHGQGNSGLFLQDFRFQDVILEPDEMVFNRLNQGTFIRFLVSLNNGSVFFHGGTEAIPCKEGEGPQHIRLLSEHLRELCRPFIVRQLVEIRVKLIIQYEIGIKIPLSSRRLLGTTNKEMPLTPGGAPLIFASIS